MKKKSVLGLLAVALLMIVPVLTACAAMTTEVGDGTWETPHVLTGGYANCFICHTGGPSANPISTHRDYALEKCAEPLCHPLMAGVEAPEIAVE